LRGLDESNEGLIQSCSDNSDAQISSANGLKSTHALALLLTQVKKDDPSDTNLSSSIRLNQEMKDDIDDKPVTVQYITYHTCLLIVLYAQSCFSEFLQHKLFQ